MVPLGSVATFEDITGPDRVPRYNLYPAAEIQGTTAPGISTGAALAAMERLAAEILPAASASSGPSSPPGEARRRHRAPRLQRLGGVRLPPARRAVRELVLPLAVILIVPMCLLAGVSGLLLRGMDINILAQIGFVVLVGLAAKNAILIVEFARQGEERGQDRFAAATEAARTRLRPILMTSFAFILGVVPLVIATGAGAEMRQALGTAVFFGMLGVTLFGLFFTPVFYVVTRRLALLRRPAEPDPAAAEPAGRT